MKKIISVILVLACMLSLAACNFNLGGLVPVTAESFKQAMDATNPGKVTITTTTVTAGLGTLNANYAVTYNSDNTATIKYDCELWAGIPTDGSAISPDAKEKLSGTVTRDASGAYSDASFVEDVELALSLNIGAISTYTISEDGKTFTANVAKDSTAAVFGVAYDFDVQITVVKGANVINSIALAYTAGNNDVSIKCIYD